MPIFRGSGGSGEASTNAYANDVAVSAATATEKANEAAASAAAALVSQLSANASSVTSSADASAAEIARIAAEAAQTAAEIAETNAAASYDNFDDRYLGPKASDPVTDNDGDPLVAGALYFSTADNKIKVYDGASWSGIVDAGTVTSVGFTAPTGFDVSGSPVTTSGSISLSFSAGYSLPTTTKQGEWDTAFSWGNHASAGYATVTGTETLTNKTVTDVVITGYTETVFALTGTTPAIDASNGTIQTWTLTGASTPTDSLASGESVLLMIDDGTANTITWTMVDVWETGGGTAPTLKTSGYTHVLLWKVSTTVYGALIGDPA